jgi:PAS domain S-box-containing protein
MEHDRFKSWAVSEAVAMKPESSPRISFYVYFLVVTVIVAGVLAVIAIEWSDMRIEETEDRATSYHLTTIAGVGRIEKELFFIQKQLLERHFLSEHAAHGSTQGPGKPEHLVIFGELKTALHVIEHELSKLNALQDRYGEEEYERTAARAAAQFGAIRDGLITESSLSTVATGTRENLQRRTDAFLVSLTQLKGLHTIAYDALAVSLPRSRDKEKERLVLLLFAPLAAAGLTMFVLLSLIRRGLAQQRRTEQALRDNEKRLTSITNNLPGGVYRRVLHADGTLSYPYMSAEFRDIYGIDPGEIEADGNNIFRVIHPDEHKRAWNKIRSSAETLATYDHEYRMSGEPGAEKWFRSIARPHRLENGDVVWDGLAIDITERKRAEELGARLGRIIERSINEVYVFDAETLKFNQVNLGARTNLGYTMEELSTLTPLDIKPDFTAQTFAELLTPLREGENQQVVFETTHKRKDGSTYDVEVRLQYMIEEAPPVFVAIIQDITERRGLEQQLRQSHRMEALGQVTGGVAHEFNNLLQAIVGSLSLLKGDAGTSEKSARMIGIAERAAQRGSDLTYRLLSYVGRHPIKPELVDVGAVAEDTTELLQPMLRGTIEIEKKVDDGLWPIHVDRTQLESALLNIAVNARDAITDRGRIRIEAVNAHLGETFAAAHGDQITPGDYVKLSVADTGTGMPPEVMAQVFEPFFTTKEIGQGTGLGLSMVYGFVTRQSGGYVDIDSAEGQGTRVTLYLPRAPAGDEEAPCPADKTRREVAGVESVLVVEDDREVLDALTLQLEGMGFTVLAAENGAEALALFERAGPVDLLLTDAVMPEGPDGFELARAVRRASETTQVVIMTGYSKETLPIANTSESGTRILRKPFTEEDLMQVVNNVNCRRDLH